MPTAALLAEIRCCRHCADDLPLGPRPIVSFNPESRIVLVSQAPGSRVHANGVAWADQSGERLRAWLGVDEPDFYNPRNFAVLPMGFCYPGRGRSGDLPPRPECAPLWHASVWKQLTQVCLTLLIGQYAQGYYLGPNRQKTLSSTVQNFSAYGPAFFPLPHPSPRNNIWLAKNEWFEREVIPELQMQVRAVLGLKCLT